MLQVWELDPETNRKVLMIDADPMMLVNDPKLTQLIETISTRAGGQGLVGKGKNFTKDILEFLGVVVVKLCEVLIEILL